MSFDGAIKALSTDAMKFIKDRQVLGLGSGRAATIFVKTLSEHIKTTNISIHGVTTSLQIKLVAEKYDIPLVQTDQVKKIDIVFDGADQIDSQKFLIKGGGGALLQENILINAARKIVIMADKTKFVKNLNKAVPIEIHKLARNTVISQLEKISKVKIRSLDRGYPFITESGNLILDCDFGTIKNPKALSERLIKLAGVMEVGLFTKRPDIIYKAKENGKFDTIQ